MDSKQLIEVGDAKNLFYVLRAIDNFNARIVAASVVSQQQQHSQSGAIQVARLPQINDKSLRLAAGNLIALTKSLVLAKVKTPLDLDNQAITIRGNIRRNAQ